MIGLSYKTTFDTWLRAMAATGRLIPQSQSFRIDRGLPFRWSFTLPGDWSTAVAIAALRLQPDAAGAVLVDLTAATPVYASGLTTFAFTLTKVQTANPAIIPPDGDADGLAWVALDVLFTAAGGTQERILGGALPILGKVTNAS